MGMRKHKKLCRLLAFFMVTIMLFTSVPLTSVAANDTGIQENVSEEELTEEKDVVTTEELAEGSLVEEGTSEDTEISPESDVQEVSGNETEEATEETTEETIDQKSEQETSGSENRDFENSDEDFIEVKQESGEENEKWGSSAVTCDVEGVTYSFSDYAGCAWIEEGGILKSGIVNDVSIYSVLEMKINIPETMEEGVNFQFDYATSSEAEYNIFSFSLNQYSQIEAQVIESGKTDYKTHVTKLMPGEQLLYFSYNKDTICTEYDDCVYIKNITITPIDTTKTVKVNAESNTTSGGNVTIEAEDEYGEDISNEESYPYGTKVTLKAEAADGYCFMGWQDSEGEIISHESAVTICAVEDVTYTAQFISEEEYKEACESIIEGNGEGDNKLITVSAMEGNQLFVENGSFTKKKGSGGDFLLEFKVTEEFEGTKYLNFDIYDPRGELRVQAGEMGEYYFVDSESYIGSSIAKTCSVKIYSGCIIQISALYSLSSVGTSAYIKNLKIVEGKDDVKISVTTEDKALGSVTGGSTVEYGGTVKLKATPADDCEFCYWKDSKGNIVSKERAFTVKALQDTVYTAVFRKLEVNKESLESIMNDESGIVKKIIMKGGEWTLKNGVLLSPKIEQSSSYIALTVEIPEGECYELSAKGNYDYVTDKWFYCAVDDMSYENYPDVTFAISNNSYEAISPIYLTYGTYTIYLVHGRGSAEAGAARLKELTFTQITGDATIDAQCYDEGMNEISENITGIGTYQIGKSITLKAPSISGYYFRGWDDMSIVNYEMESINPEMTMYVIENKKYSANYGEMPENFIDESIFTFVPRGEWSFNEKTATACKGELTVTFSVSENDKKALYFESPSDYSNAKLSLYVDGEFYGYFGEGQDSGEKGIISLNKGEHTVKWVVNNSYNTIDISNISLVNREDLTEETFTLTVEENYIGGRYTSPTVSYPQYGSEVTLSATPDDNKLFFCWQAPDGTFSTEPEIKVIMDKNKKYIAHYADKSIVDNYQKIVIDGSDITFSPSVWRVIYDSYINMDSYNYIPDIPLSAVVNVPEDGESMLTFYYDMNLWSYYNDSNVEGYLTVCVNGKEELRIPYDPYEVSTVYNIPLSAGENTVEWKFVLAEGSENEQWDIGISDIGVANAKYYTVNATANNTSYGTVAGSGKYVYNQSVTLKATPSKGYLFKEWQLNGETVSNKAEYSVFVTEDAQYTAVFEADSDYKGDDDKKGDDQDNSGKDDNKKDDQSTHTHTSGEWVIVKDATAKETGLKVKKCTVCGEEMEKEVLPKYKVSFNVKGTVPLQVKKSTTAIKVKLMDGDKVKSYKSSNTKIVTVSKKGKIKAKKAGKAKITVTTVKGAKATITIKVQKSPVKTKKIKVDKTKITLKKGESYTLTVAKTPITTLEKTTFTTSNKKVATVSKKGKIVAKKKGKATITVKSGKKKKTVKVTVK